ncbi:hypothetical protein OROHE_006423 [Orobanche hederae]
MGVAELEAVLGERELHQDRSDGWCWGDKADGKYTVKEAYHFISSHAARSMQQVVA